MGQLLSQHGVTYRDAAASIGISITHLGNVARGEVRPSNKLARKIDAWTKREFDCSTLASLVL